ncbi:hypothetical protein EDB83DRAFT_1015686 [Lactarius deliciosus]|nr:hypothetical protein EDB83DRAFT_1015686 [Lactarius deliciosus]
MKCPPAWSQSQRRGGRAHHLARLTKPMIRLTHSPLRDVSDGVVWALYPTGCRGRLVEEDVRGHDAEGQAVLCSFAFALNEIGACFPPLLSHTRLTHLPPHHYPNDSVPIPGISAFGTSVLFRILMVYKPRGDAVGRIISTEMRIHCHCLNRTFEKWWSTQLGWLKSTYVCANVYFSDTCSLQLFSRGAKRAIGKSLDKLMSCLVRVVLYTRRSNVMNMSFTTEL